MSKLSLLWIMDNEFALKLSHYKWHTRKPHPKKQNGIYNNVTLYTHYGWTCLECSICRLGKFVYCQWPTTKTVAKIFKACSITNCLLTPQSPIYLAKIAVINLTLISSEYIESILPRLITFTQFDYLVGLNLVQALGLCDWRNSNSKLQHTKKTLAIYLMCEKCPQIVSISIFVCQFYCV